MICRQWLDLSFVPFANRTLVTKHCYTTESEYESNILQCLSELGCLLLWVSFVFVMWLKKLQAWEAGKSITLFSSTNNTDHSSLLPGTALFSYLLWILLCAMVNDRKHQSDLVFGQYFGNRQNHCYGWLVCCSLDILPDSLVSMTLTKFSSFPLNILLPGIYFWVKYIPDNVWFVFPTQLKVLEHALNLWWCQEKCPIMWLLWKLFLRLFHIPQTIPPACWPPHSIVLEPPKCQDLISIHFLYFFYFCSIFQIKKTI